MKPGGTPAPTGVKGSRIAQDQILVGWSNRMPGPQLRLRWANPTDPGQASSSKVKVCHVPQIQARGPAYTQEPRDQPRPAHSQRGSYGSWAQRQNPTCASHKQEAQRRPGTCPYRGQNSGRVGAGQRGGQPRGRVTASLCKQSPRYTSVSSRLSARVLNFIIKKF